MRTDRGVGYVDSGAFGSTRFSLEAHEDSSAPIVDLLLILRHVAFATTAPARGVRHVRLAFEASDGRVAVASVRVAVTDEDEAYLELRSPPGNVAVIEGSEAVPIAPGMDLVVINTDSDFASGAVVDVRLMG